MGAFRSRKEREGGGFGGVVRGGEKSATGRYFFCFSRGVIFRGGGVGEGGEGGGCFVFGSGLGFGGGKRGGIGGGGGEGGFDEWFGIWRLRAKRG